MIFLTLNKNIHRTGGRYNGLSKHTTPTDTTNIGGFKPSRISVSKRRKVQDFLIALANNDAMGIFQGRDLSIILRR